MSDDLRIANITRLISIDETNNEVFVQETLDKGMNIELKLDNSYIVIAQVNSNGVRLDNINLIIERHLETDFLELLEKVNNLYRS